jgi:hypothetical protein
VKRFGARDRSTLVMFKGPKEVGRLVFQAGESEIKALLDRAL